IVCDAVETEAPRVTYTKVQDARVDACATDVIRRQVPRDGGVRAVDVEAQYRAERHVGVLAVARRAVHVVTTAAVTETVIEVAVGAESNQATIVVALWLHGLVQRAALGRCVAADCVHVDGAAASTL